MTLFVFTASLYDFRGFSLASGPGQTSALALHDVFPGFSLASGPGETSALALHDVFLGFSLASGPGATSDWISVFKFPALGMTSLVLLCFCLSKAGFSRSTVILSVLLRLSITKYLAVFSITLKGPLYGRTRGGRTASSRT